MLLRTCTACLQQSQGKPASVTMAYWRSDNVRVAYRHRMCFECFAEHIQPIGVGSLSELQVCAACGIDCTTDNDPVFFTSYLPGVGASRIEAPMCGPCAAVVRVWFQERGELLESTTLGPGSQAPTIDSSSVWAALGRMP